MGLIGNEIVQSRVWVDPNNPKPPALNYKHTFPITVFEAVRRSMEDENSETLDKVLNQIFLELNNKQMKVPAKPANYLMTYAGIEGAIGSIAMSTNIPYIESDQTHNKIPTEKAVADYVKRMIGDIKVGDGSGSSTPSGTIRWFDIIGRPMMYDELGQHDDGFITQRAITDAIEAIKTAIDKINSNDFNQIEENRKRIHEHIEDMDNPHNVTLEQLGGAKADDLAQHVHNESNPHNVTKEQLGLENVDNTADIDKPVSIATQESLDRLNELIMKNIDDIKDLRSYNRIVDISYDQKTGELRFVYNDDTTFSLYIPIDGLIDEIWYDIATKELVILELGGKYGSSTPGSGGSGNDYVDPDGKVQMTSSTVIKIWDQNGLPQIPAAPDEITDTTVISVWDADGGSYIPPREHELDGKTIDYIWDTNGDGYIPDIGTSGGKESRIDLSDLFIRYLGSVGRHISIEIDGDQVTGDQIIKASIIPLSINEALIADDAITTRSIQDGSIITTKIRDLSITTEKIANGAITNEKIADETILGRKLSDHTITLDKLLPSTVGDRVMVTKDKNGNVVWSQITYGMLANNSVGNNHIQDESITADKIATNTIVNDNIADNTISNDKLKDKTITGDKIANDTIDGDHIVNDPTFNGVISSTQSPDAYANDNTIPTTKWVRDTTNEIVTQATQDIIIDADHFVSSNKDNTVLVTYDADDSPVWGTINRDMLDDNIINTDKIDDNAITTDKVKNNAITSKKIASNSITSSHLKDNSVESEKIFTSNAKNRVLAALEEYGHPVYSQVTRDMIEYNAIGGMQIEDKSITPSKLSSSENNNRVLGITLKGSTASWVQVTTGMMADRAITGAKIFSAMTPNMILGITTANSDPEWLKVNTEMIQEGAIKRESIAEGAIWSEHLQEKIIESKHIMDWSIQRNNIAPGAIGGTELFTSAVPNRVLAVTSMPYSKPDWLQVVTDMIADKAVTRDKIFQSDLGYRVLGVTGPHVPPEYTMITNDFIEDDTIQPSKLIRDFVFFGTPSMTVDPDDDADNSQIPTTRWIRKIMGAHIPSAPTETTTKIEDHSITGKQLFTSSNGPRVLGITEANADAEYILIEENLIANSAVTSNKIQRDVTLFGHPTAELSPDPNASSSLGTGNQIVTAQWVRDRIAEASGLTGDGTTYPPTSLTEGSVTTPIIADRAVTGDKLFTSGVSDRVLLVNDANTTPVYSQINNNMIKDNTITAEKMIGAGIAGQILKVNPDNTTSWSHITTDMIGDNCITASNINSKTLERRHFIDGPVVDNTLLFDNAVTNRNIKDQTITGNKIANSTITGTQIADDVRLNGNPTVKSNANYLQKSLRNITISSNEPKDSDGEDGDIWFQYI